MKKILIVVLLVACCLASYAQSISGSVFVDSNSNGTRDKNEAGVKGVAVSDQVDVVVTDTDGNYTIPNTKGFGVIFISVPDGFRCVSSFYQYTDKTNPATPIVFALTKTNPVNAFTFIHGSDTHISPSSLDRIRMFRTVVDSVKPNFVLITGDLVKDALRVPEKEATSLYQLYKSEIAKTSAPVWNAPGNHEIFGIERHLSLVSKENPLYGRKMYRHYLGPDYYSFNYGGIHFIALNSLNFEDTWYFGSIDSLQIEWLKKDLATLSPKTPVVTYQHVPFISGELSITGYTEAGPGRTLERENGLLQFRHVVSNAHEVILLIQKHPYPLALGGHHHSRQRYYLETEGQQTRFEQTAAIVSPTYNGTFNFPSGVTVYKVKDGKIDEGRFVRLK